MMLEVPDCAAGRPSLALNTSSILPSMAWRDLNLSSSPVAWSFLMRLAVTHLPTMLSMGSESRLTSLLPPTRMPSSALRSASIQKGLLMSLSTCLDVEGTVMCRGPSLVLTSTSRCVALHTSCVSHAAVTRPYSSASAAVISRSLDAARRWCRKSWSAARSSFFTSALETPWMPASTISAWMAVAVVRSLRRALMAPTSSRVSMVTSSLA